MGKPYMTDVNLIKAAGINPNTGLPVKFSTSSYANSATKQAIKSIIRIVDEQNAIRRYHWHNLPNGLTEDLLERILYYRGSGVFFYHQKLDRFFFLPYTAHSEDSVNIDCYGRYAYVTPVPFNGSADETKDKNKKVYNAFADYHLKVAYGIFLDDATKEEMESTGVLLYDYARQISETILPRQAINDALIDIEASCIPYMDTALMLGTGVRGMRVNDQDQAADAFECAKQIKQAALAGVPYVPVVGSIEFQDLANPALAKAEDYMLAMQALDNFRLGTYGIDNGGLFEKKAHMLEAEAEVNGGPVGLVYQDGLELRQEFCDIVNSIWELGIAVTPSECISQADENGDGSLYDVSDNGGNKNDQTNENTEVQ